MYMSLASASAISTLCASAVHLCTFFVVVVIIVVCFNCVPTI